MTRDQMLLKLTQSCNETVATTAGFILKGILDPDVVARYCGSFLKAVLANDYDEAIARADHCNKQALLKPDKA